jgi:hypothetical protein
MGNAVMHKGYREYKIGQIETLRGVIGLPRSATNP